MNTTLGEMENAQGIIDPALVNVLSQVAQYPELWWGMTVTWGIMASAAVLAFIGCRNAPEAPASNAWYRTPQGWVIPVLMFGVVVRLAVFSDLPYGFIDEPFYFQAILTGLGAGIPDYLPNMTGSMFLWPPVSFLMGNLSQALGLPLMLGPRLATVLLSAGSLYTMSRLVQILARHWANENRFARPILDWLPLVAVILPFFCANSLYDSTFASYNPLSVFLLTLALYCVIRGIEEDKFVLLTASAAFLFLSFEARFFPFILNLPPFLIVAGYFAWRRAAFRPVLVWFAIPLTVLVGGFLCYMGDKVFAPIEYSRQMSLSTQLDRLTIVQYILSGAGVIVIPALWGAVMLMITPELNNKRRQWSNLVEPIVWLGMGFTIVAYYLVFGRVFSMAQDLALTAVFGLPLASLGAAGIVYGTFKNRRLWHKMLAGAAGALVLFPALIHAVEETHLLRHLMYSDTRNVIAWFRDSVQLPEKGRFELVNAGMASNPWSMKVLHGWFDQRLAVNAEMAFDQNFSERLRHNPDFVHVSYHNAQHSNMSHFFSIEEWGLIQEKGYEVYRIQSADNIYINYVLVQQGKGIGVTESQIANRIKPPAPDNKEARPDSGV